MSHFISATRVRSRHTGPAARAPFLDTLGTILGLMRSRSRLSELDDHLLRDIGVTRREARAEADRAAWDVPAGWRR